VTLKKSSKRTSRASTISGIMNYNAEMKNVGSGILFVVYKDGKKIYTHLVTMEMLEKCDGQVEENAEYHEEHETNV
jgi:hypothetical protein